MKSHELNIPVSVAQQSPAFSLHVRLTKYCNADCSYCSSWIGASRNDYLKPADYRKALEYISTLWDMYGITPRFLSVQYVGGEILTIPRDDLEACVYTAREFFSKYDLTLVDGCQSNLIGHTKAIQQLDELFDGRIGTSVDHFTEQRTINGSASKYKTIMIASEEKMLRKRNRYPAIYVVDNETTDLVLAELKRANREQRMLTFRPVFNGGRPVSALNENQSIEAFQNAFDSWFLKMGIIVEPFYSMVRRRLAHYSQVTDGSELPGCNFQKDCAIRSLNLEPNGDLYLCFELADMGIGKIGNAISQEFDEVAWRRLFNRNDNLHADCQKCAYLDQCQGGCMAQVLDSGQAVDGKPGLCRAWKYVFSKIDEVAHSVGCSTINRWLNRLDERAENAA